MYYTRCLAAFVTMSGVLSSKVKEVLLFAILMRNIVHVPNFEGVSGSEDRGEGDNSSQIINIGRVGDKSFKEWRQKIGGGGGGKVGDNGILTFYTTGSTKKCHFLKTVFWAIFSIRICKVS